MKLSTLAFLGALVLPAFAAARDKMPDSVVKIYSTLREPNLFQPWNKEAARESSGTGVIVDGNRILTNAHVVNYASQVFVQANQSTERVAAKVKVVVPEIDMAIIEVSDEKFFENRPPMLLANTLPAMKQSVSVYGYPVGGEQLSITQGVVSRIEYHTIAHGCAAVRIQIDAAINPGNSGGPAVSDGKLIGLVFSRLTVGENIGYLLAAEEVKMFLDAIAKGSYIGKPRLQEQTATTENEALRSRLGLKKESGILVIESGKKADDR